jgi:selenocysteine-specific elongation factor
MATGPVPGDKVLNFNVGVLGHIDSGKTSLAKAISTTASTASFDKNPQSKERGITLDLGFSSFSVPVPSHLEGHGYSTLQFTLVDCPGHASLIKTIIGGSQIIDLMMLVVDVTKGIQTQTAECLVIGEITCSKMVVVLNKVDLVDEAKREKHILKVKNGILKTLQSTRFAGATVVTVAAKPGGPEDPKSREPEGIKELIDILCQNAFLPNRNAAGPFIFSVDHCFPIKGQGTVMTGTVLDGSIKLNDLIEIPTLQVTKKVKSMQMFRKAVQKCSQGDRVGICVTQFDAKLLERGLVCSPGHLPTLYGCLAKVEKIPYHKHSCPTGGKFHITIGHETVMAKASFFGQSQKQEGTEQISKGFSYDFEYPYLEELTRPLAVNDTPPSSKSGAVGGVEAKPLGTEDVMLQSTQWALLEFEHPVTCPAASVIIGSRLDLDAFGNQCRIAFHGKVVEAIFDKEYAKTLLPRLKVFKMKQREGVIERVHDERTLIGKTLFKKETRIDLFVGMKVVLSTGEVGTISGSFGASGKYKVTISDGLKPETIDIISGPKDKGQKDGVNRCVRCGVVGLQ